MVNLSRYDFDNDEISLLSKGLNFIPAPKSGNMQGVREGFHEFSRKIKLSYFFSSRPSNSNIHSFDRKYKEISSWEPDSKYLPPDIIQELDLLQTKLGKIRGVFEKPNIPIEQYTVLKELSQNENLVFKKADKGSAIVIMDRQHYIDEALSQLSNTKFYQKIDAPIFQNTYEEVEQILYELGCKKYLTPSQIKYLKPKEGARPRTFYILPKIHKQINKWPIENCRPPGRPIVSDIDSDSYRYSELIDDFLRPFADIHPSYIKDTNHFLDQLRDLKIEKNALLVTFDVESLYTNIQPDKGLLALDKVFHRAGGTGLDKLVFNEIRSLLEISLNNNDFQFNDEWYQQISGVSMGRKFAPNFANVYMSNWEHEIMEKTDKKPKFYRRFLDDGFMIWEHSRQDLDAFISLMNSHDESINITAEINDMSVDFLDVTMYKGNRFFHHNILDSKVHFKMTDTHELLDHHSFHPKHTFNGIIKSQLIRFLRICNNMQDFHDATSMLFTALAERRHYSKRLLRYIKAEFLSKYHEMGDQEDPCGAAMKCCKKRCECCLWIKETSYFGDNLEYSIDGRMDCQSKNLIYMIECTKCNMKYIGETQRSLRERLYNHLSDIRTYKETSVANHFNFDCVSDYDAWPMTIYPIEFVHEQGSTDKNKKKLLLRETFWINELNTLDPNGLNMKTVLKRNINISIPYNKTSQKAYKLIRECFDNLKSKYPKQFNADLICAYKRNKNLGDILTSSKLK